MSQELKNELTSEETKQYIQEEREKREAKDYVTEEEKEIEKANKRKKKKGIIAGVLAAIVATTTISLSSYFGKKKSEDMAKNQPKSKTENLDKKILEQKNKKEEKISLKDIDYIVNFEEVEKNINSNKKVVSGNVDLNKVVRGKNGTLYASQESLDNAENITNNSTETTTESVKDGGYVVKNEQGEVVTSGESKNDIPAGYHKDPSTGRIIKDGYHIDDNGDVVLDNYQEESNTLPEGTILEESTTLFEEPIIIESKYQNVESTSETEIETDSKEETTKPDITNKEETTKPDITNKEETTITETTTTIIEEETFIDYDTTLGTINVDGTYTDPSGNTWVSKEEYIKFLNDVTLDLDIDSNGNLFVINQKVKILTR